MPNFQRSGGFNQGNRGGNRDFRGRGGQGRGFGGKPQMHQAICDDCGIKCEVPFKPSGDRPVLCTNCFRDQRGGDDRRNDFHRDNERSFRDSSFRRDDHNSREGKKWKNDEKKSAKPDSVGPELAALSAKLDRVLNILISMAASAENKEVKPEKEQVKTMKAEGSASKESKKAKKSVKKAAPKKAAKKK